MSEWQDIATAPTDGTAVVVFFANYKFRMADGSPSTMEPIRDYIERCETGWYQDATWREAGTGHDMFESWRGETQLPTHWLPLPAPPQE